MMFNQKALAKQRQAAQLKAFTLSSETDLYVPVISKTPGILYSKKVHHYTKGREELIANAGAIHFIHQAKASKGFVWHAPLEALEKALRYGIVPVEAPTAKSIAALGIYKQQVLTRAYEKGIVSSKYAQKEALVTFAQDTMTALQGLERLVNTLNPNETLEAEKARIHQVIDETINAFLQLKLNASNTLASLVCFDQAALPKIETFYHQAIQSLRQLQRSLEQADASEVMAMLKPTGMNSILISVKTMSIATLVKTQELNQNITYSRSAKSLMRGSLNNVIEDALKALRDYEADPHNPILPEHQGHYSLNQGSKTIAVDFTHLAHHERQSTETLRAILEMSSDGIQFNQSHGYTLNNQALKITRFTKWTTNAKPIFFIKRMSAVCLNIISESIVGLLFDLPVGFLTGFLSFGSYQMPSLASKLTITVNTGAPTHTKADELVKRLSFKDDSAGALLGQKLGSFISETILDIGKGIWQSTKNVRFKGFDEFISDFKTGGWEHHDNQEQQLWGVTSKLKTLKYTKAALERRSAEQENTILLKHQQILQHTESTLNASTQMACPPYHLSAGEWDDISNASIDGIIITFETFIHNIHAKHPFIGLIFSGAYAAGGLTILAPSLMGPLNNYILFSKIIGNVMARGTESAAIASGFTQAKVLAALFEAMIHGGDSWFAVGAKQFEKNPANLIVYSAIAVGLGYCLANYAQIPGVSQYIQEDTGNVPEIGWAFAGAKLGLLFMELLSPKNEKDKSEHRSLIHTLDQDINPRQPTATLKEITRLQFLCLLQENQALLPELDNENKRKLMFIARSLFKGMQDQQAKLRSLKETLYPQVGKSIFTRTITLVADYIPLIIRCLLSPISASWQPWRDLGEKVMKDTTRVAHGLSRLIYYTIKTFVRLFFRGIADLVGNEIPARIEGLLRNNNHSISAQTYAVANCYEQSAEAMRQLSSTGVDAMRRLTTAPAVETMLHQTQQQTMTKLNAQGFFGNLNQKQYEEKLPTVEMKVSTSPI